MKRITFLALVIALVLAALPASAAKTETSIRMMSRSGDRLILSEDTSAANAELVLIVPARTYGRRLRSVQIVCSASTTGTLTVTQTITRAITSGAVPPLLPDILLTDTTSGAMFSDILLLDIDTLTVTVPAAGVGIDCSAMIIEEVR